MAEFNHEEREATSSFNHGKNEMEPGIGSPADGWEVVGSSPGSPAPEARADVAALEEAMASAGSSGSLLQDDYFCCPHSQDNNEVLPVSTVMAEKANEDDGHSSERSDAVVSLDSDTDVTTHNDCMCHGNADLLSHYYGFNHNDEMHINDTLSHDDLPFYRNLLLNAEHGQYDVDECGREKMHDEFMMNDNELVQQDDRWSIEGETYLEGVMHKDGDNLSRVNHSSNSSEVIESAAAANILHDGYAMGFTSGLEVLNSAPMSSHEMGDSEMSVQLTLSEGSSSTALVEETDGGGSSHGIQAQDSVNEQDSTIAAYNRRPHKGFVCVSWVWSQFIRWQTQLGHANTIWSVALAAAVMGILVLGRGWQRLQAQNQSLRSQLWAKEKRITQLMFQLMQTKDSLSKVRRVPVICVKPALQVPQDNF